MLLKINTQNYRRSVKSVSSISWYGNGGDVTPPCKKPEGAFTISLIVGREDREDDAIDAGHVYKMQPIVLFLSQCTRASRGVEFSFSVSQLLPQPSPKARGSLRKKADRHSEAQ